MRHPRVMAFLIARRFPDGVPTAEQVMRAFPEISRASAFRYVRDYREAWQAQATVSLNHVARQWPLTVHA